MEDEESLEACALISKLTDPVKYKVDNLLSDGVVTASVIVGGIFFAGDKLLWVEQLAVCASAYLVCKNVCVYIYALSVGGATTYYKKVRKTLRFSLPTYSPTTVGSRSTNTARGTCLPAPVSLKNVLKESSPPPMVLSEGIWPSG